MSLSGCQWGGLGTGPAGNPGQGGGPTVSTTDRTTPRPRGTIRFDGGGAGALAETLRAAEENPGSTLAFEPGTYRLDASDLGRRQPHSHFTADGLSDVTIDGNDARLVLEDPTLGAIGIFNSDGTTLQNLAIDYDPPPYTQGTITAVDASTNAVEVELQEGFPTLDSEILSHPDLTASRRWATVHDPETGDFVDVRSPGATTIKFDGTERIGDRRFRLSNLRTMRSVEPGRLLVVVARWPFKHALLVFNCVEPTLEDVTLHMTPAFAVLAGGCEAPTFRRVAVEPRPGSGRVIASTADGIHVLGCAPGPTIEDCHMERLQDDAYVVATLMNPVEAVVDDRTVRVEPLPGTLVRPGDTVAGVGEDFARLGTLPAVESVDTARLALPGDWGWPVRIRFAEPVAGTIDAGDFLWNRSRSNQGFAIRNCVSREVRPRHVRVTSRDGVVEGNELDGCAMPAVMLAGGTFFSPQSPPEDVTVRDNTIRRSGLDGLTTPFLGAVDAWIHLGRWRAGPRPPGRPIRNLTIAGNDIRESAFRGVQVNDASEVAIRDNVVEGPNKIGYAGANYGVGLENVHAVRLVRNRVSGSSDELDQFAVRKTTGELTVEGNSLTIDGEAVPPEVVDGT